MNALMGTEPFLRIRKQALAGVSGETLEIGFGTGLNLSCYPSSVSRLTAVDVNPGMSRLARRRIDASTLDVRLHTLDGASLPFPDAAFDTVVSTWTLCSITDFQAALGEIRRVLGPAGRFVFVEHGLSPDPGVGRWQRRLTPVQKRLAAGCHLDRDIRGMLEESGFAIDHLDMFYMDGAPRLAGFLYSGSAHPSTAALTTT
jgi:ubiquinone/menaquinone biosynthesis C-methylase UbiE